MLKLSMWNDEQPSLYPGTHPLILEETSQACTQHPRIGPFQGDLSGSRPNTDPNHTPPPAGVPAVWLAPFQQTEVPPDGWYKEGPAVQLFRWPPACSGRRAGRDLAMAIWDSYF